MLSRIAPLALRVAALACLAWAGLLAGAARANDSMLCRAAILRAEAGGHVPEAFLSAIARVESGRPDQATGSLTPWPWTINAEGKGSFFATKAEAIAAVQALQARGVQSIDVGCLQVNLMYHPDAFASLDQAFEPMSNAAYASQLLQSLFAQMGSWPLAAAAYHSQTPVLGAAYQQKVLAEWAVPDQAGTAQPPSALQKYAMVRAGHTPTMAMAGSVSPGDNGSPVDTGPGAAHSFGFAMGRTSGFAARTLPTAAGIAPTGRGLTAYRLMPTALALKAPPRPS